MRRTLLALSAAPQRLVYDHRYHFGSANDCFKHVVLLSTLQAMRQKESGFTYCETHAGCGLYDPAYSATLREHEQGLERLLLSRADADAGVVSEYAALQRDTYDARRKYLGSAALAATQLRSQDDAILFEKSEEIHELLQENVDAAEAVCGDGYDGLAAASRERAGAKKRALVLIDPPYQMGSDTDRSMKLLRHLRKHWRAARVALWYPASPQSQANNRRLFDLAATFDCDSLRVEFAVDPSQSRRLAASGFLLVQPPYRLEDQLCDVVLPDLADALHESATIRTTTIPAATTR